MEAPSVPSPSFVSHPEWKPNFPAFWERLEQYKNDPQLRAQQLAKDPYVYTRLISPCYHKAGDAVYAEESARFKQFQHMSPEEKRQLGEMKPSVWFSSDRSLPLPEFVTFMGMRITYGRFWKYLFGQALLLPHDLTEEDQKLMLYDIERVVRVIKCNHCKSHAYEIFRKNPPDVSSKRAIVQWLWWWKNQVNLSVGKPALDFDTALLQMCDLSWDANKKELVFQSNGHSSSSSTGSSPFTAEESDMFYERLPVEMAQHQILTDVPPHLMYPLRQKTTSESTLPSLLTAVSPTTKAIPATATVHPHESSDDTRFSLSEATLSSSSLCHDHENIQDHLELEFKEQEIHTNCENHVRRRSERREQEIRSSGSFVCTSTHQFKEEPRETFSEDEEQYSYNDDQFQQQQSQLDEFEEEFEYASLNRNASHVPAQSRASSSSSLPLQRRSYHEESLYQGPSKLSPKPSISESPSHSHSNLAKEKEQQEEEEEEEEETKEVEKYELQSFTKEPTELLLLQQRFELMEQLNSFHTSFQLEERRKEMEQLKEKNRHLHTENQSLKDQIRQLQEKNHQETRAFDEARQEMQQLHERIEATVETTYDFLHRMSEQFQRISSQLKHYIQEEIGYRNIPPTGTHTLTLPIHVEVLEKWIICLNQIPILSSADSTTDLLKHSMSQLQKESHDICQAFATRPSHVHAPTSSSPFNSSRDSDPSLAVDGHAYGHGKNKDNGQEEQDTFVHAPIPTYSLVPVPLANRERQKQSIETRPVSNYIRSLQTLQQSAAKIDRRLYHH